MLRKAISEITLTLMLIGVVSTAVSAFPEVQVGVKAGDWIKLDITIGGTASGTIPQWIKVEFLSVVGTSVTVKMTMHMSDGTEQAETGTIDLATGSSTGTVSLQGFVIPANSKTGDSIYMSGYGSTTITGETTKTYAGTSRTVVYASVSQYGAQITYYWDKQTGVIVEASGTSSGMILTAKATATSMWQAGFDPIYLYIIVVIVAVIAIGTVVFIIRRKRPSEAITSTLPPPPPPPQQ